MATPEGATVLDLTTIRAAALRAEPYVIRSPVIAIGDRTFAKLESLQPTGSFKVRGFAAAALSIPNAELDRGLITMSAGNAAQAAAYVAHRLGVGCKTVMPDTAPNTKVNGVKK